MVVNVVKFTRIVGLILVLILSYRLVLAFMAITGGTLAFVNANEYQLSIPSVGSLGSSENNDLHDFNIVLTSSNKMSSHEDNDGEEDDFMNDYINDHIKNRKLSKISSNSLIDFDEFRFQAARSLVSSLVSQLASRFSTPKLPVFRTIASHHDRSSCSGHSKLHTSDRNIAQCKDPASLKTNDERVKLPFEDEESISDGFTATFGPFNCSSKLDTVTIKRREHIKEMMRHAWTGYTRYAWGHNELRPITKQPHHGSVFHGEKMGATIVDAIDTLFIMGMYDQYYKARDWIEHNLDFDTFDGELSVFETNIRFIGGLLSIYALTNDRMFLTKATQCAQKLLPAFETPSGIPRAFVDIRTGHSRNPQWPFCGAILSEFGSIHLEFKYLSHVTGDPIYAEKVDKIRRVIRDAKPRYDGLYNNYIDVRTGQWLTQKTHISMGGLGDSFYEYLLKAYIQSDKRDEEALQMYNEAISALERKLVFTSNQSQLVYFGEFVDGTVVHKMGTLACFSGGMLAMGAMHQKTNELRDHYVRFGAEIARTCRESCVRAHATNLGPEAFVFTQAMEARSYRNDDNVYLLRPEIIETYFYMWRYTHDEKYRQWAWDFVQALERNCRVEAGYSGLRNVYDPRLDDVQQSFFLAEVLKYLYLIYSDDQLLSLDDWVFNTEAHPLPILKQNNSISLIDSQNFDADNYSHAYSQLKNDFYLRSEL